MAPFRPCTRVLGDYKYITFFIRIQGMWVNIVACWVALNYYAKGISIYFWVGCVTVDVIPIPSPFG